MNSCSTTIQVGGLVKIIKESKTKGLVGAHARVKGIIGDYVDVDIDGYVVRFNKDEVIPLSFKDVCGIDKLPTLYHGTDLKSVCLTDEERKIYKDACFIVIKLLYDYYKPYLYDNQKLLSYDQKKQNPELADNIGRAMSNLLAILNHCEEWEYRDFYLTTNKMLARKYANEAFAGGEIGFTAYYLIRGLELIDLDFSKSEKLNFLIKSIIIFAEAKAQPAIFSFDDLSPEYLRGESGESLKSCIKNGQLLVSEFRYVQPITLDPSKAELIDKE